MNRRVVAPTAMAFLLITLGLVPLCPPSLAAQDFEQLYASLARGPIHSAAVETGVVMDARVASDGTRFPYFLQIPEGYTPDRQYPVRFFLHGGVSRAAWEGATSGWWRSPERVASEEYIGVFPAAWNAQRWWQPSQLENLRGILREVGTTYNVDENRVVLIGVSDGGTGAYYAAFRDTTPWASFLPFISHPAVLLNPRAGASGSVFRTNLTNKPLFIVNGEDDRLYPTRAVDPFVADFSSAGVEMVYRPLEGYGHETAWWPDEASNIEAFIDARPRDPHPVCMSWEAEPTAPARAHWLRLDSYGDTPLDVGMARSPLLDGGAPSGRVDAQRVGNEVRLGSSGVTVVTLLLSPDVFDFAAPVRVRWNGVLVFDGTVAASTEVLQRWAERDHDRTMLYGAEVQVTAPVSGPQSPEHLPAEPGSAVCRGV